MFYSIQHLTKFHYTSPVSESVMEARMHPRSEGNQRCLTFHLAVSPRCRVFFAPEPEVTPVAAGKPLTIKPAPSRKPANAKPVSAKPASTKPAKPKKPVKPATT